MEEKKELDPTYEYIFRAKMEEYIERAREWWADYEEEDFYNTGTYPLADSPGGMFIRFYRSPSHSSVKGIQAFPYVTTAFINIPRVPGGLRKFIHDLCLEGYQIEEFTLIEKMYLHGTERSGQFICIIPTELLNKGTKGRYVWLSLDDIINLSMGRNQPRTGQDCRK